MQNTQRCETDDSAATVPTAALAPYLPNTPMHFTDNFLPL